MFFEIGGQPMMDAAANFILPLYQWICNIAAQSGGVWDLVATAFESIVS